MSLLSINEKAVRTIQIDLCMLSHSNDGLLLQNGILSYQEVDDYLSLLYRQGKELKEFGM